MAERPVFYDASGRRRRRFALAVAAFIALILLSVVGFVTSIGAVQRTPLLPVEPERPATHRLPPPKGIVAQTKRDIRYYTSRLFGGGPAKPGTTARKQAAAGVNPSLAVAFHTPWDDASAASLARHIDQLDWVVPGWVSVTGADHHITVFRDVAGRQIINRAQRRPVIVPMIQNALNGSWDGAGTAALLHDPVQRKAFLDRLEPWLGSNNAGGAFFDFEDLPASAQGDYRTFLGEAKARFGKRGWVVAIAAPVGNEDWNLPAYAPVTDKIFLMAYDEHETGGEAGPIASQHWFAQSVASAARGIPAGKLVVAVGSYAYDWHDGGGDALDVEEAWQAARDSDAVPTWDKASGNSSFAYMEGGSKHTVWLLDAASAYNQLAFLNRAGIRSVALWRLGSEDPGLWSIFGRNHRTLPPPNAIDQIPAGTNVDIEGSGEILRIGASPVEGARRTVPGTDGMVQDVLFDRLPSPYVVYRTGYRPGLVALTFDDGPDPTWTPQILDILKAKGVPATFFIVGENALTQRGLLQRLVDEGHEVGSHTYTHPNLATVGPNQVLFELNANQRLFQAFTGHSMKLFRAPYFGDAEPSTADEIEPALQAQERGYISVGLHVDPDDWKRPGVQAIVDRTIEGVEASTPERSGNIVLLHDSGGDRSETVAALPAIIDQLRAKGYRFVLVSTLAGVSRHHAMPGIKRSDRVAAGIDLALFTMLGGIVTGLHWLFAFAITIGIARALVLSALALIQAKRESRTVFPPIDPNRFVTVMIPAFNEEAVIVRAVERVLASSDVRIEVIVIDDGSADRTSALVEENFAADPRVRLLTLQNGGKARALNRGLELANGEIVIALDADTQFEPTTIARLARWFDDPTLGAVAGNAKVGNRVNLVTKWQALEYITAQNLERRALARLDAMTVVPGAVGAWRLAAIRSVGGYPDDTLAEDQDLTIAIQHAGWKIRYDQYAIAWTEAPETFRGLAKQRFRWAYGTLQCLWKYKGMIGRSQPRGLGWVGLPQAIVFQIVLAAISPIIDLALLVSFGATYLAVQAHGWGQTSHDIETMLAYWLIFTAIDLLAAVIAFALERREQWRLLWLLIPQRIGYRQVMYYVVLKAIAQALRGPKVGWGKLQRTGRVDAEPGR
ncbi:cellulose synthase/poly-beta-1,6-N-acetylglucosamine synthase-like glycosyltransferase/peptidoglycan/xylan/chitin deacetylase (PgdA/CDA1 family)/spore germination protein YaaH [Sphingomonas jinjuensis]|uniref:Chitooligosaccharide deacetylase n=1 Tax=Sphingomonas jinjuensis TaxID=535907 RepID=A0A840FDA8_9SPHN|nr:glycosyltransferase [Sphingomonas jinjuensis]MBB4154751.1 cellulose synthase/poly-beta-1,6-N-acetylglucosamine synthase-like glycosyltransferase/peptidoglycan/xylan/chitin deacetylase (PgdA/CDA1 family)/spore germination protein YaaH [Sphingomonas jinjuensis]